MPARSSTGLRVAPDPRRNLEHRLSPRFRLKSSFGTAIKFWGDCWWANLLTYANVIVLALMIMGDPSNHLPDPGTQDTDEIASPRMERDRH